MKFDTIFHLAGEQILPNYIALRQFECKNHVIIVSEKTKIIAERLKTIVKEFNISYITVSPYDVPSAYHTIISEANKFKSENIAFNLTGGTKPMFIAAFLTCQNVKAEPFYIETTGNTLDFMTEHRDFEKRKLTPVFDSIDTFIKLAGYNIIDKGVWEENPNHNKRVELTNLCWKYRGPLMNKKEVQNKLHDKYFPFDSTIFSKKSNKTIALDIKNNGTGEIRFDNYAYDLSKFFLNKEKILDYFGGGWFEEYCFLKLKPLLNSGKIKDLRIGLKPDFGQNNEKKQKVKQEFDICFTDGLNFYIIECKAGAVSQAHLQKIENIAYEFGGTFGKGILCSSFMPYGNTTKRIETSRNISGVFNYGIEKLEKNILSIKPKMIVK